MTGDRENAKVALAGGATAADLLGALLRQASAEYPQVFSGLTLPGEPVQLKTRMAELLPQFEAARIQSTQAAEIARALCLGAAAHLRCGESQDSAAQSPPALAQLLERPVAPLSLVRVDLPGPGRLRASADFGGRLYRGAELEQLANELELAHFATKATTAALTQLGQGTASGGVSLAGQRFVLFGAGAELSPVYALLEAGAEVLWLDRQRPPIDHLLEPRLAGALLYVDAGSGGVDLLAQPAQVRATILEFAEGGPVHFGLHAFASGQSGPLLVSLVMNEIVRSLPRALVRSVSYLLSPTSVSFVAPEDAAVADERRSAAPTLRRALLRTGSLQAGHLSVRQQRLSCAVVQQQGASFQVAEYIAKRLAAEALASYGNTLDGGPGQAVFANMAPITNTRSLASPLMKASILGAPSYDLLIAEPSTARSVCALLTVHDLTNIGTDAAAPLTPVRVPVHDLATDGTDENGESRTGTGTGTRTTLTETQSQTQNQTEMDGLHPVDAHAAALARTFALQFHGGVQAQPYALEGIVRLAALRGIAQRPKLAWEFWR